MLLCKVIKWKQKYIKQDQNILMHVFLFKDAKILTVHKQAMNTYFENKARITY